MNTVYEDYRREVLKNPIEYPELSRIERAKNELKFGEEMNIDHSYNP